MPLHPPTDSALTSPVYFGVRLNSSRVRTPGLLRAHLQTARQTLQCDFIVIPTASAESLAASKKNAAQKSIRAVDSTSAEAARDIRTARGATTTTTTATGNSCTDSSHSTDITTTATLFAGTRGFRPSDERSPLTDNNNNNKEEGAVCGAQRPEPNSLSAGKREDSCASSPLISCHTTVAATTSAESVVLVESPPFATARATIPAHHLAEAATDFPSFCKNFLTEEVPRNSGSCALRDAKRHPEGETTSNFLAQYEIKKKPSFRAVDGGLATLPATYSFEPSTESDLPLDSQTWSAAVVCELSSWISPDVGVLPRRRKVVTVSPESSDTSSDDTAAASPSVSATSSLPSAAASSVSEGCLAPGVSVASPHTPTSSHSRVAVASPEPSYGIGGRGAAEGDTAVGASRRPPPPIAASSPAGAQNEEAVVGQEEQRHHNKRSRTAAGGGELKTPTSKGTTRGQNADTREIEQGHTFTHDQQQWHEETSCLRSISGDGPAVSTHQDGTQQSDCRATAQTESPAATADSFDRHASSPLAAASFRPAVGSSGASTAGVSAVTKDREGASPRCGRKVAAKREKQRHLYHGMLRHWSFHETAWQREMQWATHVGVFAVITPRPVPHLIPVEYSRLLRAALNQLQPPIIWVKLPLVYSAGRHRSEKFLSSSSSSHVSSSSSQSSDSEDMHREDETGRYNNSEHSRACSSSSSRCCKRHHRGRGHRGHQKRKKQTDPWRIWQYIRSMVGPHPSLGVCLELTPDLPDSDSELERWFAEPLRAVVLSPSLFTTSSSCDNSNGTFSSNSSMNRNPAGTCQALRRKGRVGNRIFSTASETTARTSAGVSGVCLSPRHHLFLMKCAQHRVKLIFQPDDDEEDEEALDTEQPEDLLLLCKGVQQQEQVGQPTAEHFPSLSAAVGHATGKQQGSHSPRASAGFKRSSTNTTPCNRGTALSKEGKERTRQALPVEEMQPYISYVAQQLLQLPPLKHTELFSAPYRDVLQSPMQPLADNLSAGNYEVFEKDPVKYLRYKEATLMRLREVWPGTSTEQRKQQQQQQRVAREGQQYQEKNAKKQQQQQQEGGKLLETQQREGHAAAGTGFFSGDASSQSLEAQKKRGKNSRRRHGQSTCNRASCWGCENEDGDAEEEYEGAADYPGVSISATDAACSSPASASGYSFPCSTASPSSPPGPSCLSSASPCLSSSSSIFSADASDWCLRGAGCTVHAAAGRRLVLTVVGAGRGPLVQAALEALREAGVPLCRTRVFAVEKNWNAVITLRSRVRSDACRGWRAVEVVEADMREAGDRVAEQADILISELLGSFGDNELSAECLDGAQMRLLKKGGISIPSAYISSVEPVATQTLWQAIDSYKDPKQFECTYVVNMFAKYFPAKEGPRECFHYRHPHFLLPFGDERNSTTGGAGGSSSSTAGSDSDSSDSGSHNENKDSRKEGCIRRRRSSCTRSRTGSRSDQTAAVKEDEDTRCRKQAEETASNTYKRHDKNAGEPVGILHVKETARSRIPGSEKSAASWCPKQVSTACAAGAANTMDGCTKSMVTGPAEETGGSFVVRKGRAKGGESPCVVEKTNKKKTSKRRRAFTAAELTALRHRRTRLSWRMQTDAVVHGLAGYFHCCLYKNVFISIDPRSFSEGMFSWFPLFIPFRQPVYVRRNEKLEVYIAREGDEHKVWYEWAVLRPTSSELYNHMGRCSYIGK